MPDPMTTMANWGDPEPHSASKWYASEMKRLGISSGPVGPEADIGTILGTIMGHPVLGAIFGQIGSKAIRALIGPELPYGEYAEDQLQAISSMIPELRAGAAGQVTPATKAIRAQVKTEGTRMQQSFAQGARKAGLVGGQPGGTAPYRAQQGRVQVGMQQAMTQRLGAYQTAAQEQLLGLAPTAMQHAGITQMADLERAEDLMGALGRFNREYQQNQYDPRFQEMLRLLKEMIFKTAETPTTATGGAGGTPPVYYGGGE